MQKDYVGTAIENMQEKLIREIAAIQTVFSPSKVIEAGNEEQILYDDWFQFALVLWNRLTRPEHGIWQLEVKVPVTEAFHSWLDAVEAVLANYSD